MKVLVVVVFVVAFCTQCTDGGHAPSVEDVRPEKAVATSPSPEATGAPAKGHNDRTAPVTSGAQRAYIDPETGELTTPPAGEVPEAAAETPAAALGASEEALEEKQSPVPGGGVMVDLKGRFHSPLSATIDKDGKTKIEHQSDDNRK